MIFEVISTVHATERTMERLLNHADIRPEFPETLYEEITKRINWIQENVEFDINRAYQIHLANLGGFFQHWETGKHEASSQGDMVYALIRNNSIISIFFRRKPQRFRLMPGVDEEVSFEQLQSLSEKEGGKFTFSSLPKLPGEGKRDKYVLNLPFVNILGKEWFIDEDNQQLIKVKNINRSISINNALELFPEDEAEKIFNPLTWTYPNKD